MSRLGAGVLVGAIALGLAGLALGVSAAGWLAAPTPQRCGVERVLDGDSLRLSCAGKVIEVRLQCIDAPEGAQIPWGAQSRRHLRELAGRQVELVELEIDRFGRTVGEVYGGGGERPLLNLEQVRAGQAAVYRRFCDSPEYDRAEAEAKADRRGIWSESGAHQTPWTFRHRERR